MLKMSPQYEAVIRSLSLAIFQRWQISERGTFSFVKHFPCASAQSFPAVIFQLRGMMNAPKQAAPFDEQAVDVAFLRDGSYPVLLASRVPMNVGYHGVSAEAVFGWGASIKITGYCVSAIGVTANPGQPAFPAVFLTVKTKSTAQVGEFINKIFNIIFFIFNGGCDGESVAAREKAGDQSALGGGAFRRDEAETFPMMHHSMGARQSAAVGGLRAVGAMGVGDLPGAGFPEGDAVLVNGYSSGLWP